MSRAAVLHHLVEVIATEGTAGLTVRGVASSAGVAIGTVQHYFPTKSAMLLAAMEVIGPAASEAYEGTTTSDDPTEQLLALVGMLVSSGPESRIGRVWLAFAAHAVVDPIVGARYRELWASMHRTITGRMAAAAPSAPAAAVTAAATELLALADGLAVAVLTEPARVSAAQARAIIERRCRELLSTLQ